jgi:starch-binding outer membrane protein, SusD/RagB family
MKSIKNMYFFIPFILLALFISSCEEQLDLQPNGDSTADQLLSTDNGTKTMANGCLALMRDELSDGYGDAYVRVLLQTTEFAADNVLIIQPTTDPLWLSFNHEHTPDQGNIGALWQLAYKCILTANTMINNTTLDETSSDLLEQYIGEAYFYRGLIFFDLARLFSFPPSHGLDNKGIVLRTELAEGDVKARATVGETYAQIISDLKKGSELMTKRSTDGIKYGNKYAALGLLSRAYLFTEDYDSVVYVANQLLDGNSPFTLDTRDEYIANLQTTYNSNEAMFILYHDLASNKGDGSIGSMYNGDGGWGEVYPSQTYLDLITKQPNDVRLGFIERILDDEDNPELYSGTIYEKIYITKYSYQDGVNSLHSPIFIRLSEVLLNRAEAYAHLGDNQLALDDVNTIRERAGISGSGLITIANLATHGYNSVLDAVLAERRLELAFEGYRRDDLLRNKIDMDRSYSSAEHPEGMEDLPYSDPRQIYFIPQSVEIENNPLCIQND